MSGAMKPSKTAGLTAKQVAEQVGVTNKAVYDAVLRGSLERRPDGLFDAEAVQSWRANRDDRRDPLEGPRRRVGRPPREAAEPGKVALGEARRRRELVRLEKEQLELRQLRGELVDVEAVRAAVFDLARQERASWEHFPLWAAPRVATALGLADDAAMRGLQLALQTVVREFLGSLADLALEVATPKRVVNGDDGGDG